MPKTVIGLFDNPSDAQSAVQDLVEAGFSRDHLSMVTRDTTEDLPERGTSAPAPHAGSPSGAGVGATAGAIVGGVGGLLIGLQLLVIPGLGPLVAAGPLVATLVGAGAGVVAGGLLGALVDMGVPREEAEYYTEAVRRGGTLVTLQTSDEMADRAAALMKRHHAVDVKERAAQWRQAGWTGYDSSIAPIGAAAGARAAHEAVLERDAGVPSRAEAVPGGVVGDFETYEPDFRRDFETTLANRGYTFEHHLPAYRYGYSLAADTRYRDADWAAIEPEARRYWEERNPGTWEQFRNAILHAWDTVRRRH